MPALSALWASPLLPALLALAFGWRPSPIVGRDRWTRGDTGLAVGAALVGAASMAWITAPWTMKGFPFTASDFSDYCGSLDFIREGDYARASPYRSIAAGYLPALLSPHLGIVGGLGAAALLSGALTCGAIFLGARALHSRSAGLAAVILAAALPPLAALTRTVTFYPEMVAATALVIGAALASVRFRTPTFALLAGVGVGMGCLSDVRGMVFAGPALVVAMVGVLVQPRSLGSASLRVAALLLPVAASWWLAGRLAVGGWALQDQAVAFGGDALRLVGADPGLLPYPTPAERFRWGVDPLDHLVPGLRFLSNTAAILAENAHDSAQTREVLRKIGAWPTILGVSALVALAGLYRRPVLALAAVGALAPSVAVLAQALATNPLPRMFATGLPAIAIVLGVAFAALLRGPLPRAEADAPPALPPREALRRAVRPTLALLVLTGFVGGVVPTWLGPTALWRTWNLTDSEPRDLLVETNAGLKRPGTLDCQLALQRSVASGHPLVPDWYEAPPEGWLERVRATGAAPSVEPSVVPPRLPDLQR